MKKIYFILLALLPTMLWAQPTLNNFENWTTGMVANYNLLKISGVHPGPAGANLVWDFSSFTDSLSATTTALNNGFTYQGNYPAANMCLSTTQNLGYVYLHQYGGTSFLVGNVRTNPVVIKFMNTDSGTYAANPMNYTDLYHDTTKRTYTYLTQNFCGKGSDTIKADGWGTLVLPHNTVHPNVLRIKSVRYFRDTLCGGAAPTTSTFTTYAWYDVTHVYPLMKIDSTVTPLGTSVVAMYSTIGLGVGEIMEPKIMANVFPNPNNGSFTLNYSLASPKANLIIRDIAGRIVYTQPINGMEGKEIINISSLSPGLYNWELMAANEISATGKLSVIK